MAWSWKKAAIVGGATAAGGVLCFLTGGAAAPAVGAWIGSTFMGLSGAAATSAGLAALGGGALAAGGAGMAGGAAAVSGVAAVAGATAAGLASKKLAKGLVDGKHCRGCHALLESGAKFCDNCGKKC